MRDREREREREREMGKWSKRRIEREIHTALALRCRVELLSTHHCMYKQDMTIVASLSS